MAITGYEINQTFVMTNTVGPKSLIVTRGMSDVQILADLCAQYNTYIIVTCALTLLMLIGKVILGKMIKKNPNDKAIQKMYKHADDMMDIFMLLSILMQLSITLKGILW